MMVNCPKCGFSQPQDQYCAKCGVDMVTFRPVAKPFVTRLVSNTTFQVSVLAFVVLSGGLYARQASREKLARTIAETPIARDAEQQETELAAAQAAEEHSRALLRETVSASVSDGAAKAATNSKTETVAEGTSDQAVTKSFVASSAPALQAAATPVTTPVTATHSADASHIRVYFIEAQRNLLSSLLSDARQSSSDGTFSYGVVTNLERRLKASRAWESLEMNGDQAIHMNQPNVIFKGTRDQVTGQNLGFTIQVTPISRDENGMHLQIDANRVLRDQTNGLETFEFALPESFALARDSAFILTGALPHRALSDNEERLYRSVNVLKSMATEAFRAGQTDVAIVIETR